MRSVVPPHAIHTGGKPPSPGKPDRKPCTLCAQVRAAVEALLGPLPCRGRADSGKLLLALRFLTGVALAGIYPVGMKIAASWFPRGLGAALGLFSRFGLHGTSVESWQTIDLPILVDWPNRPLRKIDPGQGKPSTTR